MVATRVSTRILCVGLLSVLAFMIVGTVVAQEVKPDPPPVRQAPHPDAKYRVDEQLIRAFMQAFEAQGNPRVVVIGPASTRDLASDVQTLTQEVGRIFSCKGEIDIIERSALSAAARREVAILDKNKVPQAHMLVGLKAMADYLLRIRCVPTTVYADYPWRVSLTVISLSDAREISFVPQDLPRVWSISLINKYTHYFVSKTMRNLIERWGRRGSVTEVKVTIIDVKDFRLLKRMKDVVSGIPGVSRVKLDASTDVATGSISTLRLRYAGTTDDLYLELLAKLEAEIPETKMRGTDLRPNAIVISAARPEKPKVTAKADGFDEAYRKAGKPRFLVMVNRAAPLAGDPTKKADIIIDQSRNGTVRDAKEAEKALYANSLLEDALFKKLLTRKVKCVDGRTPRQELREKLLSRPSGDGATTEADVRIFVRDRKLAEIFVSGVGRVIPGAGSRGAIEYTFRAVNVADDAVLGTATARATFADAPGDVGSGMAKAMDLAADKVLKDLIPTLISGWTSSVEIGVKVVGAPEESRVRALAKFIQQNAGCVADVYNHRFSKAADGGGATAEFVFVVNGNVEDLVAAIENLRTRSEKKLPYDVTVQKKGPGHLVLTWQGETSSGD
jgi:hypothetical protein